MPPKGLWLQRLCREGYWAEAPRSAFLLVDLQIQDDFLFAVEAGDGPRLRLCAVFFSVNLVIDVRVEAAKAIVAGVVADVAANRVGARVFQEDHTCRDGAFSLVGDKTADGLKRSLVLGGFFVLVLWLCCHRQRRDQQERESKRRCSQA